MKVKTISEIINVDKRQPTESEIYDAKVTHPGFGSPDCTCFIAPLCQHCVDWCPTCKKETCGECPEEHYA